MLIVGMIKGPIRRKKLSSHIKKKAKPANSQPTTLAETNTQTSNWNLWKTRSNCCDQRPGQAAIGIPAINVNLVDLNPNKNLDGG